MMMLLVSGCAKNGRATNQAQSISDAIQTKPVVIDTGCNWASIIWISKDDVLTAGTARQIYDNNTIIVRNCGPQNAP